VGLWADDVSERRFEILPVRDSAALHERCRPGSEVVASAPLSTEVLVIGTGAGGAIAGTELARAGRKVTFLESGGAHSRKDFDKRSLAWSVRNLYDEAAVRVSLGKPPILLVGGRAVGGSTVINSAITFRPPDKRLREWARLSGSKDLLPEAMKPFVDEVWERVGVFKMHPGIGRKHNIVFARGVERLGIPGDWFHRNAPACVGCGVCHLGCPSGGKASVDKSILPDALRFGAEVLHHARAEGIIVEGGRVTGAEVVALDDRREAIARFRVNADVVIVAGSAIGTPVLLDASGVGGDQVGKRLSIQPAGAVIAEWDEDIIMWDGVPQGYYALEPEDDRIIYETQTLGLPEMFALVGEPGRPEGLKRLKRMTIAGALTRDDGQGTVSVGDDFRPKIRYDMPPANLELIKLGLKRLTQIYFAAGAKAVWPLVHPRRFYTREADALAAVDAVTEPEHFAHVHSSHPLASCRMGPPGQGVVDPDGKVHGTDGLYIMDGSILPSAAGVNPQISIMSIALSLSRRLAS
jgi:choline dehydrogenase-like flavoprotein